MLKSKQELDFIREKIMRGDVDLNRQEKDSLKVVYDEIQETIVKGRSRLDLKCSGCLPNAIDIVRNYIIFHEPKSTVKVHNEKKAVVVEVDSSYELTASEAREMQLKDLRKIFPEVSAKSIDIFVDKLVEQGKIK